jgi:hypothetical protein
MIRVQQSDTFHFFRILKNFADFFGTPVGVREDAGGHVDPGASEIAEEKRSRYPRWQRG